MANGWAPDGAVQDQIDDTVSDAVLRARGMMPTGDGSEWCDDCGNDSRAPSGCSAGCSNVHYVPGGS